MPVQSLPSFNVSGYTNMNVIGSQSLMTEILAAQTLASGDVTLTAAQAATIGIIEVTVGHATNAFIVPAIQGNIYHIVNNDASLAANIKVPSGTAVTIAATKSALVYITVAGQVKRMTADA